MQASKDHIRAYLDRIEIDEVEEPSPQFLTRLQQAHLSHIPFENTYISEGRIPLSLTFEDLFEKIITNKRGGVCYEQNIFFGELLKAMGFEVKLHGAQHPKYRNDMDHAFLEVVFDADEDTATAADGKLHVLADVGLLLNPHAPLKIVTGKEISDGWNTYRLDDAPDMGEGYLRMMQIKADRESEQLAFGPQEYQPEDYRERCDWYATSENSRFTKGRLVAIDTPEGRAQLSLNRYTVGKGDQVTEREVSEEEAQELLRTVFKLEL